MGKLYNLARMSTATTGTGTITLGSAVAGFLSFAAAGVGDGETVTYAIQDGSSSEIGRGVYTASGTTLTRASILASTNSGSAINLSGNAIVFVSPAAEDFNLLPNTLGNFGVKLVAGTNVTANRNLTITGGDANRALDISAADVTISSNSATLLASTSNAAFQIALDIREVLTSARTYYVRADGSDSNNGLTNSSGGAFLTIQKAIDVIYSSLDLGGYDVTVQVGAGTYTGGAAADGPFTGKGGVVITGDTTTPSNAHINTSGPCITCTNGAILTVEGFKFTSSGSWAFFVNNAAGLYLTDIFELGSAAAGHFYVDNNSFCYIEGVNYTISGGAPYHQFIGYSSKLRQTVSTVTISGTPNFSAAFVNSGGGYALLFSNTYSGSATGTRYIANENGIINVFGAGATHLPGDASGSTATQGQYF